MKRTEDDDWDRCQDRISDIEQTLESKADRQDTEGVQGAEALAVAELQDGLRAAIERTSALEERVACYETRPEVLADTGRLLWAAAIGALVTLAVGMGALAWLAQVTVAPW